MTTATNTKTSKTQEKFQSYFSPFLIASKLQEAITSDLGRNYPDHELTQLYESCDEPDVTFKHIFSKRQIDDFQKKFTDETSKGSNRPQKTAAFRKFEDNLLRLTDFDPDLPSWTGGPFTVRPCRRTLILARAKSLISLLLGDLDLTRVVESAKHSSGTTQGLSFSNTNLEDKMRFPLSATKVQAFFMIEYFKYDPLYLEAMFKNSPTIWSLLWELDPISCFVISEASDGTTVPKESSIDRFIALEKTVGMFLQKGCEAELYRMFSTNGEIVGLGNWMDVEVLQAIHRLRAQNASVFGDDATVDWSNASDNWLRLVVQWLLPPRWFDFLVLIGSRDIAIREGDDVRVYQMPMISTMGNATTFPLESLLFFALGMATVSLRYDTSLSICPNWAELSGKVSVFGDDCILPTQDVEEFIYILESLGHQCNIKKSFTSGYFRESCGGDYYLNRDVRPFYLKWPTTTKINGLEPWLYIAYNNLFKKYNQYFGVDAVFYSSHVFRAFYSLFKEYDILIKIVPPEFPDDSGLHGFLDSLELIKRGVRMAPMTYNRHGCVSFSYTSYKYPVKVMGSDHCHYATWLKIPVTHSSYSCYRDFDVPAAVSLTRKTSKGKTKLVRSREGDEMITPNQKYLVKRGGRYVVRYSVSSSFPAGLAFGVKQQLSATDAVPKSIRRLLTK